MSEREQFETRVGRTVTRIERNTDWEVEIYFDDGNSLRLTADAGSHAEFTVLDAALLGAE
jgi:hypothetical protein